MSDPILPLQLHNRLRDFDTHGGLADDTWQPLNDHSVRDPTAVKAARAMEPSSMLVSLLAKNLGSMQACWTMTHYHICRCHSFGRSLQELIASVLANHVRILRPCIQHGHLLAVAIWFILQALHILWGHLAIGGAVSEGQLSASLMPCQLACMKGNCTLVD